MRAGNCWFRVSSSWKCESRLFRIWRRSFERLLIKMANSSPHRWLEIASNEMIEVAKSKSSLLCRRWMVMMEDVDLNAEMFSLMFFVHASKVFHYNSLPNRHRCWLQSLFVERGTNWTSIEWSSTGCRTLTRTRLQFVDKIWAAMLELHESIFGCCFSLVSHLNDDTKLSAWLCNPSEGLESAKNTISSKIFIDCLSQTWFLNNSTKRNSIRHFSEWIESSWMRLKFFLASKWIRRFNAARCSNGWLNAIIWYPAISARDLKRLGVSWDVAFLGSAQLKFIARAKRQN